MQEDFVKKIRENLSELVDLTSNADELISTLRANDVLAEEDENELLAITTPFDKKSKLYWQITQKDDVAFGELVEALRATGNDVAAERLLGKDAPIIVEAEVSVEQIDKEAIAVVDEIEKELDNVNDSEPESVEIKGSEVEVQITAATESESEADVGAPQPVSEEVSEGIDNSQNSNGKPESPEITEENQTEVSAEDSEEDTKPAKQVTFEEIEISSTAPITDDEPSNETNAKEFIIERDEQEKPSPVNTGKSIVAINKEKFEKNSGGTGKVKFSFGKNAEPVDDAPKESNVKSLRNFWQKLGSANNETNDVLRRQGSKTGGLNPNRRTMAL